MIVDNIVAVHAVTELQSSTLSSNYSARDNCQQQVKATTAALMR